MNRQLVTSLLVCLTACGDGVSSTPTDDAMPADASVVTGNKRVFVTDQVYVGGLLGGLAGADMKCDARAAAAGLPGKYKAWLSDRTTSAAARLTHSSSAYLLTDGSTVAANFDELASGTLQHAINLDPFGATVAAPMKCLIVGGLVAVWTGTNFDGTSASGTPAVCHDWTKVEVDGLIGNGLVGNAQASGLKWTFSNCALSCTDTAALYCIEQ